VLLIDTSSSTTSTAFSPIFQRAPMLMFHIGLPNGGIGNVILTMEEAARFKRGMAMLAGEFREQVELWDGMTPAERACYERDADWVCERIEQCKMELAGLPSSAGNGTARPIGLSSPPST
jgi:hypothetical protein